MAHTIGILLPLYSAYLFQKVCLLPCTRLFPELGDSVSSRSFSDQSFISCCVDVLFLQQAAACILWSTLPPSGLNGYATPDTENKTTLPNDHMYSISG
jgi:hypothetical protein